MDLSFGQFTIRYEPSLRSLSLILKLLSPITTLSNSLNPSNSNTLNSRVQWYPHPSVSIAHFYLIHYSSHSSIFHSTHTIHVVSSLLFYLSQLCDLYHVCSDSCYRMFIWCEDRKQFQSIRRNCFCL